MGQFLCVGWLQPGIGPKTERLAYRGGRYSIGAGNGLFALALDMVRTYRHRGRGFRPAFAPSVGSPMVMAVRPERGKRGLFPPRCKTGKSQRPHATSRQRKRRGALFVRWPAPTGNSPKTERLACRGGYYNTVGSGLFALILNDLQTYRHRNRGFRPALIPYVRGSVATAAGTVRG